MPKPKLVERAKLDLHTTAADLPYLTMVLSPKGGVGKTLVSRTLICGYHAVGICPRIVQVDKTPALPALYGDAVIALSLPSTEEQRADPLAVMSALEPCAEAIDASIADGRPLVADVGGGPTAAAFTEFLGKGRVDAHIASRARTVVFMPMVAESATMAQTIELGLAVKQALPSATLVPVLNERDGKFRFYPGSAADQVMQQKVLPFIERHPTLSLPAVPAGALAPFEAHGLTFTALIEAEPAELARRIGMSRTMTAMIQGDVAEWLTVVWSGLRPIIPLTTGDSDA